MVILGVFVWLWENTDCVTWEHRPLGGVFGKVVVTWLSTLWRRRRDVCHVKFCIAKTVGYHGMAGWVRSDRSRAWWWGARQIREMSGWRKSSGSRKWVRIGFLCYLEVYLSLGMDQNADLYPFIHYHIVVNLTGMVIVWRQENNNRDLTLRIALLSVSLLLRKTCTDVLFSTLTRVICTSMWWKYSRRRCL